MSEEQSSYRQIMKATSLFGGVQVFTILISIIRSKLIAVLLGPSGMGISGLLTATTGLIASLTNFGLSTSAIKDISAANNSGDNVRISTVATIIRRLVWITGILGAIVTLILSPWLSQITFGNSEYTFAFIWLSITLLLNQISVGQTVLLRGMRKLKYMAQSSVIGSAMGLITTIPLYYFYGNNGIVPGIIVSSIVTLLLTWFYTKKIDILPIYVSRARTVAEGKGMLKMGFMISLSGLISLGASYITRIYISNTGGINDVGLFNAGFAIINTYVSLIFTAMGTDFYPRLASVGNNNEHCKLLINQQAEVSILILAPIITIFIVLINWVIILFYSDEFLPINDMLLWTALGIFFKAASWSIAFILLAKGESKLFFWSELIANTYLLVFNIVGYMFGGLSGLGISFLIGYMLYLIQIYYIAKNKYKFSYNKGFYIIFCYQFTLAVITFLTIKLTGTSYSYIIGFTLISLSSIHAYKNINRKINIKSILLAIKKKK